MRSPACCLLSSIRFTVSLAEKQARTADFRVCSQPKSASYAATYIRSRLRGPPLALIDFLSQDGEDPNTFLNGVCTGPRMVEGKCEKRPNDDPSYSKNTVDSGAAARVFSVLCLSYSTSAPRVYLPSHPHVISIVSNSQANRPKWIEYIIRKCYNVTKYQATQPGVHTSPSQP